MSDWQTVLVLSLTARNSKPLEVIGTYDPIPKKDSYDESGKLHKDIRLDVDRAKYWVGVGAQPTDTVWRFLSMLGVLEPKYRPKAKNPPPPLQTDTTATTSI
ncbi:putative mitochondrial 37s ribosomal protein mrps16 [Diaporthe ampelina]|uniref:Putative mitochondrial 37s ribosomal protein mrps16 n=1 Tax=Diaporthe ampelina TaxID=1214573 RepID=A0A0G2HDI8_9PEZI|nr:putative mitochondrial 37s ribosomal protein mrps16 [Diaporthe ampelina]